MFALEEFTNKIRIPNHAFKLGRIRAEYPAAIVPSFAHMKDKLGIDLGKKAVSFDYLTGFPANSGVLWNDTLGDCAFAGMYHRMQVVAFKLTGKFIDPSILQPLALKFYEQCGGYDPNAKPDSSGQNPTDQGGDPVAIAKWLMDNGLPMPSGQPNKFSFCFTVDPSNEVDMSYVAKELYGVGLGVVITDKVMPPDGSMPPSLWPAGGNPEGGHFIWGAKRTNDGIWTSISWGLQMSQSPEFMQLFTYDQDANKMTGGNLEVVTGYIDEDMFDDSGKGPFGLNLPDLKTYIQSYATDIAA